MAVVEGTARTFGSARTSLRRTQPYVLPDSTNICTYVCDRGLAPAIFEFVSSGAQVESGQHLRGCFEVSFFLSEYHAAEKGRSLVCHCHFLLPAWEKQVSIMMPANVASHQQQKYTTKKKGKINKSH
jgi:hypothetical protein